MSNHFSILASRSSILMLTFFKLWFYLFIYLFFAFLACPLIFFCFPWKLDVIYLVKETAINMPFMMWCRGVWEGIQDFPPHFGWAGYLPWAQVRNSLLLGPLCSIGYTWAGGLWLTRFPRGQALLMGSTRHTSKWFLLSSSCQEHMRIFLWYLLCELCWAPGDK